MGGRNLTSFGVEVGPACCDVAEETFGFVVDRMTSFCFLGAEDRLRGIVPSSAAPEMGVGDSTFSFESVTFDFFRTITFFFGDPSL